MSSPNPLESVLLGDATSALLSVADSQDVTVRLEVLEGVAAELGGWQLGCYRETFAESGYNLSLRETTKRASVVVQALSKIRTNPNLALCRLAQPPLSVAEQRRTGAYYTDFRLARFIAQKVSRDVKEDSTVIDTASGTGVLLVALAIEAFGQDQVLLEHFISNHVYGVDLSKSALRGARLALSSLVKNVEGLQPLGNHLLDRDSLTTDRHEWTCLGPNRFDIVIGNPPWEKLKQSKHELSIELGNERHYGADHEQSLESELQEALQIRRAKIDVYSTQLTAMYPLAAEGEFDLYKAFVELAMNLVEGHGSLALLVPAGLIRSSGTESIRRRLLSSARHVEATIIENRARFFAIDTRFKFLALYAAFSPERRKSLSLEHAGGTDYGIEKTGLVKISRSSLSRMRPDLTVPEVRNAAEWDLYRKIMSRGIRLSESRWCPIPMREVDMTKERPHFVASGRNRLPVIEGRMVQQFRIGTKAYVSGTGRRATWEPLNPGQSRIAPQFWINPKDVPDSARDRTSIERVGFCDVTGQTNERTIMAAMIPPGVVCGNKVPTLLFDDKPGSLPWSWLAVANSFVFDWMARRIVTTSVNYFLLMSLPMPSADPEAPAMTALARGARELHRLDLEGDANLHRIGRLRANIDARVAHLYGLTRDDVALILSDFPLLDRNQPALPGETHSTITTDAVLASFEKLTDSSKSSAANRFGAARKEGAFAYLPAQYDSSGLS